MDLRRLRVGEWIVGACGLLLLIALFLPWYGNPSSTAWESFTVLDVILALLALAALSVPVVTAMQRVPAVPLALESLTALFALVAVIFVLIRVLNLPGDAHGREVGLWLGLLATLGIIAGGLIAMRDERRSPDGRPTDVTGVPVSAPREVETQPAPGPGAGS
jgi:peptidoglycan/LPS O-acetylase OafA/YrhL